MSVDVREELLFWAGTDRPTFTSPIMAPTERLHSVFLAVDASDRGWGAHLLPLASGPPAHGFLLPSERAESSTHREVHGLLRCLQAFDRECAGALVYAQVDNQNVGRITHRGSARPGLTSLAQSLFRWCTERRIDLHIRCVPRALNTQTDAISKISDSADWRLHPRFFCHPGHSLGSAHARRFSVVRKRTLPEVLQ